MSNFIIYALIDPRTSELRYIGKSCSGLKRCVNHTAASNLRKTTKNASWLKSLVNEGLKPLYIVIQEFASGENLYKAEQMWIKYFREIGCKLNNHADGGPGSFGTKWSLEARQNLSAVKKGIKISEEQKKKISAALTGTKASEETKALLRKIKGTPEARFKNSRRLGGTSILCSNGVVYSSIRDACKELGVFPANVRKVILGKYKFTGGYSFKRVNDDGTDLVQTPV